MAHVIELVFLDKLLFVENHGLFALLLQAGHLLSPLVLLLEDSSLLALCDHTAATTVLVALEISDRERHVLVGDRAVAGPLFYEFSSRSPRSSVVVTLAPAHVVVTV